MRVCNGCSAPLDKDEPDNVRRCWSCQRIRRQSALRHYWATALDLYWQRLEATTPHPERRAA